MEVACDRCKTRDTQIIETPNSPHYAKEVCNLCGGWLKWIKSPENEGKRTKTSKYSLRNILKFHNKDKEFCFFCLRTRDELGLNETITIDHIEEISKGGEDELGNLQILCTACHRMKNWLRLYMNWHLKK